MFQTRDVIATVGRMTQLGQAPACSTLPYASFTVAQGELLVIVLGKRHERVVRDGMFCGVIYG